MADGGDNDKRVRVRHGLSSSALLAPGEDRTVWEAFEQLVADELQPLGAIEGILAHRVAAAAWRLLRVERLEGAMESSRVVDAVGRALSRPKRRDEPEWEAPAKGRYDGLAKLARHESQCERTFFRSLSALRRLQEMRGGRFRPGLPD